MSTTSEQPERRSLEYGDLQRGIFLGLAVYLTVRFANSVVLVLLYFLLVFILAAVFNPVVVWLEARRVPRAVGAVLIGVSVVAIGAVTLWFGLAPIVQQGKELADLFPEWIDRTSVWLEEQRLRYPDILASLPSVDDLREDLLPEVRRLLGPLGRYTLSAVGGVVSMVLLGVLVLFTLANPRPLVAGLLGLVPIHSKPATERFLRRALIQLQRWAIGSLTLGLIVGMMSYIGLRLLGIPSALLFAVIAGVGEMIPTLGPVVSAIPPLLVAFGMSPSSALGVLILYVVIQQLENNLIVPVVMGESLDLHPVSIIFMVVVMASLFGLLGAVMAVPVTAILKCGYEEFYLRPRHPDVASLRGDADEILRGSSGAVLGRRGAAAQAELAARPTVEPDKSEDPPSEE